MHVCVVLLSSVEYKPVENPLTYIQHMCSVWEGSTEFQILTGVQSSAGGGVQFIRRAEHQLLLVIDNMPSLQHFQHQLASKHPLYYTTMRLGRGLKDRCTKSDPERDILQGMLDELKNKWTIIRSIAAQR